jgi:hypothetical protein
MISNMEEGVADNEYGGCLTYIMAWGAVAVLNPPLLVDTDIGIMPIEIKVFTRQNGK